MEDIELKERLTEQIKLVAQAREDLFWVKETLAESRKLWETENKGLLDRVASATTDLETLETCLRALTLEYYWQIGNKAPAEGVAIREVTRLQYDPGEALQWGIEHKLAIKLDVAVFEKIAKATDLDFVVKTKEPQATIALNLAPI